MKTMKYIEALREALREEMDRDERVIILGEDVETGFPYMMTKGLHALHPDRVLDTPICENGIIGVGVGAALTGMRPVCDICFGDFITLAMDQIVNQAAKLRFMTGGQVTVPLVVRTPMGHMGNFAAQHSQWLENWFSHVPGLKVAIPSSAADVKGLMKTAVRDNNPVVFLEHKMLYQTKGEVPEEDVCVPFGVANVLREGKDATIVALSLMVNRAVQAAEILEKKGISVSVIDPRTIAPLDIDTIINDVKRTGRLVIVDEANVTSGFAGEIAARVLEGAFDYLDAPIKRVGACDIHMPFSTKLEQTIVPSVDSIVAAVETLI